MPRLRILFISNWFPPVVSGSSFYAKSLAESLRSRGHEVEVVTLDWGEEYAPDPGLPFPVVRLPVLRIPRLPLFYYLRLMGFAFTPQNVKRLKHLIVQYRPDILHQVNHIFDTSFLTAHVAKSLGIPLVGSITTPIQHQNPWVQKLYHLADAWLIGKWGVGNWDGVVSLDRTVHDYVGRVYGPEVQKRSVVIPFGVRLEMIQRYGAPPPPRPPSRPQILMAGHMHPFRNPTQLIRAMKYVLAEVPDARLILAGRGDLEEPRKSAREMGFTEEQVKFLGETPHLETIELMKTSQVFVTWVTGPYRSLGTAPLEAMLCGVPVVSDLPEDLFGEGRLQNGANIILVNSKDPRSVAQNLIRLLKDEGLRERVGSRGREFVSSFLSWDEIAKEMEQFYARLITQKKGTRLEVGDPDFETKS